MIVDTSAILAIILKEPERGAFERLLLEESARPRISAGTAIELASVSARHFGGTLDQAIKTIRAALGIVIAPVTAEQAIIGRDAYRRYGIGTRHPARLNLGDCFAYALSKESGEPLLFKGDDFIHTDVDRVEF